MDKGSPVFLLVGSPDRLTRYGDRSVDSLTRYGEIAKSLLGRHGRIVQIEWVRHSPLEARAQALDARLSKADALITTPWLGPVPGLELPLFDESRWQRAEDLKVIAGTYDFRMGWIDLKEASQRGVVVVDTSRAMAPTVAEFGVAITLALLRDIPRAIDIVRGGEWIARPMKSRTYVFRDLADCRVGLAGYGSINRHYRKYIEPYGCEVGAYDPFVADDVLAADSVRRAESLVELARRSDIFVVAIPPTPDTLGIVDEDVLDALPNGSLFVLLSRMAVVDQAGLWRRLRDRELRAAIDVFDPEPPRRNAWFRRAPNVLPTPHIAGNVVYAHERCFREACVDALRVLAGDLPRYPVTARDTKLYDGTLTNT